MFLGISKRVRVSVPVVLPGVSIGGGSESDSDVPVGLIITGVLLGCAILPFLICCCLWIYAKCFECCDSGTKLKVKHICCILCRQYSKRKNGRQNRATQRGTYNTSNGNDSSGPPPVIFNLQNEMEKGQQNVSAPNNKMVSKKKTAHQTAMVCYV